MKISGPDREYRDEAHTGVLLGRNAIQFISMNCNEDLEFNETGKYVIHYD